MRRNILIAGVLLAVVVIGVAVVTVTAKRPEWSTSSPEALAEFQKGLDASDKFYYEEARAHFAKAMELDPNFLMAKYFLVRLIDSPDADPASAKLLQALEQGDLSKLTDRERFLLQYALAGYKKDTIAAEKALSAYAAKKPDDPYVLERQAAIATARQDWPEARRLLTRLVEVAPNRVSAYNQLGYLEMGQGRFADAQKMFDTYRYIAPDQANPHDSLGELFILLGRYDEAKKELEEALRIKPEFCKSYQNLVQLALMDGRADEAEQALARANGTSPCGGMLGKEMRCQIAYWPPLFKGDWEGVWKAQQASCTEMKTGDDPLQIWVALRTGRRAEADAFEKNAHERLAKMSPSEPGRRYIEAFVAHIEGARLLVGGEPAKAAERFRFADQSMSYRGLPLGLLKIINRVVLARALQASGAKDEAATVLAEARAVNPKFVDRLGILTVPPASS
ncbi:MAG: tetratricopeptide repeat protein [Thermoanaerobaculaceae bacterium]|jgi:tetratricopeptide (TPR) repeat protein